MKTLFCYSFLLLATGALAQAPVVTLSVEEIPVTEPQLSDLTSILGATPHTTRVYANIPDNWEVQVIYGMTVEPLTLTAAEGFYQDPNGGPTTLGVSSMLYALYPLLQYDSWVTIGYEDDTDNTLTYLPLDGTFFNTFEAGGDLVINDFIGANWFESSPSTSFPPNTADVNGQVLLGQFTSTGPVNGCLNMQVRRLNADGTIYDPPGSAISEYYTIPNLCFEFIPPVVVGECPGDFTGDNSVGTADLLMFTAGFGCDGGCPTDLTGDDKTTGSDVLIFLSVFGSNCNN